MRIINAGQPSDISGKLMPEYVKAENLSCAKYLQAQIDTEKYS